MSGFLKNNRFITVICDYINTMKTIFIQHLIVNKLFSNYKFLIISSTKTTLLQFSPFVEIEEISQYIIIINLQLKEDDIVAIQSMFRNRRPILIYYHNYSSLFQCEIRVSTKWLNFLRKICAISAQIFFANFTLYLRMKRNEFCAVLRGNIFCESCAWNEILVLLNFFCAICAKPQVLRKM